MLKGTCLTQVNKIYLLVLAKHRLGYIYWCLPSTGKDMFIGACLAQVRICLLVLA